MWSNKSNSEPTELKYFQPRLITNIRQSDQGYLVQAAFNTGADVEIGGQAYCPDGQPMTEYIELLRGHKYDLTEFWKEFERLRNQPGSRPGKVE